MKKMGKVFYVCFLILFAGKTSVSRRKTSAMAHSTMLDLSPHKDSRSAKRPKTRTQRVLNVPVLVGTIVVLAVLGPAAYFWHEYQIHRMSDAFLVRADALVLGSPTINQNTLLPVYRLFSVINPIRDKGKPAAVFGSYGWSGEAVKLIEDHLNNLKFNVTNSMSLKFYPSGEKAEELIEFGAEFGMSLAREE